MLIINFETFDYFIRQKMKMQYLKLKNVLMMILCLTGGSVLSQEFEGTVRWAITTRFADPEEQARLEAALKKQQQTTVREEAERKSEANAPKKAEGTDSNMPAKVPARRNEAGPKLPAIPTLMLMNFQNGNVLTTIDGANDRSFLYLKEKNTVYSLNPEKKTYWALPQRGKTEKKTARPETTEPPWERTAETATILDYKCVKYTKSFIERGKLTTREVWLTNDIREPDMSVLSKHPIGRYKWNLEKLEGVPMRLVSSNPEVAITFQVSEIVEKELDKNLLRIPGGFTQKR